MLNNILNYFTKIVYALFISNNNICHYNIRFYVYVCYILYIIKKYYIFYGAYLSHLTNHVHTLLQYTVMLLIRFINKETLSHPTIGYILSSTNISSNI